MGDYSRAVLDSLATLRAGLAASARFKREPWIPVGLLSDRPHELGVPPRHLHLPPEAFPILQSGREGIHYALWLDDPRMGGVPQVVLVSPRKGLPETIRLVAETPVAFLEVVEAAGLWRDSRKDLAADREERAALERAAVIRHGTLDSLGVAAPEEPPAPRPPHAEVRAWLGRSSAKFHEAVDGLLSRGCPGLALALVRDVIVDSNPLEVEGFDQAASRAYRALGRDLLARILELTLEWHRLRR
jgi:hypothetical protein